MPDFEFLIITDIRQVTSQASEHWREHPSRCRGWKIPGSSRDYTAARLSEPWIPRSQWRSRIAAIEGIRLDRSCRYPAADQNGLGYCWCYGSARAFQVERTRLGLPPLNLCPESVGGPCTGWRNEGGYASEALRQMERFGICESSYTVNPHRLQPETWNPAWAQNALSHEAHAWLDLQQSRYPPTLDDLATQLLKPRPISLEIPAWGHLICALALVEIPQQTRCKATLADGTKLGVLFQNSWGPDWPSPLANGYAVLEASLCVGGGAAVPEIVT